MLNEEQTTETKDNLIYFDKLIILNICKWIFCEVLQVQIVLIFIASFKYQTMMISDLFIMKCKVLGYLDLQLNEIYCLFNQFKIWISS